MISTNTPIVVDSGGQAYVGEVDAAFSTIQPSCAQPPNQDVLVFNSAGSAVVATSPLPGAYLALDGKGGLYSAGLAYTLVFFSTPHAFQTEYGGGDSDAFAAKVDFSQPAGLTRASVLNAASLFPGYVTPFLQARGESFALFACPMLFQQQVTEPLFEAINQFQRRTLGQVGSRPRQPQKPRRGIQRPGLLASPPTPSYN